MKGVRRTVTGRIVYDRKKHSFTVKRLGSIASTLFENEKGNMPEWRYIAKVATQAWGYHAELEGRGGELYAYFDRFNVCDPIVRAARDFYSFIVWLIDALEYLTAIPYVGTSADLGILVLKQLYDREVHRKLNYMVGQCKYERQKGEREKAEEAGEAVGSTIEDIIEGRS